MIMLIDGNNLAYRSHHTPQGSLSTKAGESSGVILGVLNSIKGLLEKFPETSKVIVCWDGGKAKWRLDLFPEYKANRSYGDTEEEKAVFEALYAQMDELHSNLHSFGIHSIKLKGWEADDIIHVVCKTNAEVGESEDILIITSDKDMLQLITPMVSVFTPYKNKVISTNNFYEETGITQDAYLGYRSLVGDTSDNINGIYGIAEKTAKSLMDKYGHIDNILNAKGSDKATLLKAVRTSRIFDKEGLNILARNNKIMNLNFVPYDVNVETEVNKSLGIYAGADFGGEAYIAPKYVSKSVKEFCTRWQFVSILSYYMAWIAPFTAL